MRSVRACGSHGRRVAVSDLDQRRPGRYPARLSYRVYPARPSARLGASPLRAAGRACWRAKVAAMASAAAMVGVSPACRCASRRLARGQPKVAATDARSSVWLPISARPSRVHRSGGARRLRRAPEKVRAAEIAVHQRAAGWIYGQDAVQLSFSTAPSLVGHEREQDGGDVISELMPPAASQLAGLPLGPTPRSPARSADPGARRDHRSQPILARERGDVLTVDRLARQAAERNVALAQRLAERCCRQRSGDQHRQLAPGQASSSSATRAASRRRDCSSRGKR